MAGSCAAGFLVRRYIELDTAYVENWSFWLDVKILLRTAHVVDSAQVHNQDQFPLIPGLLCHWLDHEPIL